MGTFSKLLADCARGLFSFFLFLLVKCFPWSPICETGSWSLVCLSVERHNSVPKRYLKASTEHKQCQKKQESAYSNKQHRLQQRCGTARLVFRTLTEVLRLQTHWTSTWANATVQFHSPPSLPSPPTSASPAFLLAGVWAFLGLGISCHSQVRTGLLPAGTEHKLGFKVTKPLIAAVTRLLKPVYIILLDKILYVLDEK